MRLGRTFIGAATASLLLGGCAVGPDFERPAAPKADFSPTPLPAETAAANVTGGEAQKFAHGEGITAQWWTLFQSPALNELIEGAVKNSPTLQAADATLRQAEETLRVYEGGLYPSVDGNFAATRQKNFSAFGNTAGLVKPYTLYQASVSVSYGLDIFGGLRRRVESTAADAERARFQLEAAYLTLTANIVTTAVQNASLRAQIEATQSILDVQDQQLGVLRRQLELGGVAEADVLTQQTAVAQTRAALLPLQRGLSQSRNQLLALAGRYPSDDVAAFDLASLKLPETLPVSLPSQLIDQRPDVRAAEAALHSASAQVGVAIADMLPQVTLSGNYGTASTDIGNLFSPGTSIWNVAGGLTQPIFHGGQLLHQKRAAVAVFDGAAAQYRGTVINAFQNVADVLRALEIDAEGVKAQLDAERSAATSLEIAQNSYRTGATNFLTLLDAQRTYQQARVALVQAQAARYADTAALFAALGGGWWNRSEDITKAIAMDGDTNAAKKD